MGVKSRLIKNINRHIAVLLGWCVGNFVAPIILVMENEMVNVMRHVTILHNHRIKTRRPCIVLLVKKTNEILITD